MKEFLKQYGKFRYKKEFSLKIAVTVLSILFCLITLAICFIYIGKSRINSGMLVYLIISAVIFAVTSVVSLLNIFRAFRRIVVNTDIKFQQMERYNETFRNMDKSRPFEEVLNDYLEYFNTSAEGEYSARLLQKQAELDYLQSQINPHFLYNTLDSIRGQAINDNSEKTANMIQALSKIFRYTIGKHDDIVPLKSELENIKNYMALQQYRFQDRFEWRVVLESNNEELLTCNIPKLTLQPIVENAVKHGMDRIFDHGLIEISIYSTQSRLILTVSDNGPGMDVQQLNRLNESFEVNQYTAKAVVSSDNSGGMGLMNVNARLKLLYGDSYGLTAFSSEGSGAKIQIVLPLEKEMNG